MGEGYLRTAVRLAAVAVVLGFAAQPAAAEGKARAGSFDFYVLSLSWAPTYCATAGSHANRTECDTAKRYGLVVHGLWPQSRNGYPSNCASRYPSRVPFSLGRTLFDIMPGIGLVGHEWRTHGTCTGLSQKAYFALIRRAREKIAVPESLTPATAPRRISPGAVEAQFIAANPGLTKSGIAVTCRSSRLDEVRICLTRDLAFHSCPAVDADACPLPQVRVPKGR